MSKEKNKKLIWQAIVCILVYFGSSFLVAFIPANEMVLTLIWHAISLPVALILFKSELKSCFEKIKGNIKAYFKTILKYFASVYLLSFCANFIVALFFDLSTSENQLLLETMPLWFLIFGAIISAPLLEEIIFRGAIRKLVKPKWLFIIVSSLVFGSIHIIPEIISLNIEKIIVTGTSYFVLGGYFAYIYAKTDNILINMGVHFIQNSLGVIAIFFI